MQNLDLTSLEPFAAMYIQMTKKLQAQACHLAIPRSTLIE